MEVILLERVEKLGRIGDIVTVKNGYARNFLLPRGKALRATDANKARFEAERAQIEAENDRRREAAEREALTMVDLSAVLIRQASHAGSLYGSVSARDIAEALAEAGHKVARTAVVLDQPIKTLGIFDVKLVLHPEVSITMQANVARSHEEAELQAQGIDVTVDAEEREAAEAAEAEALAAAEEDAEADVPAEAEDAAEGEAEAEENN